MTARTTDIARRSFHKRRSTVGLRGAFTLVEMVVVMGIIILLIGILAPAINRAWTVSLRTSMWSDLGAIQTALEAYRQRHGDYPRVEGPANGTGFAVLAKALVGPAAANASSPAFAAYTSSRPGTVRPGDYSGTQVFAANASGGTTAVNFVAFDGADGNGYRVRADGTVQGALLPPERFNIYGCALIDRGGQPILYYPANTAVNFRLPNMGYARAAGYGTAAINTTRFNANDNVVTLPANRLQLLLGDNNMNGLIDADETPAAEGPYLLLSAGPDRTFGPENTSGPIGPGNRTDDVGLPYNPQW
jgi:type II secretory pathway pseudopilin PulG